MEDKATTLSINGKSPSRIFEEAITAITNPRFAEVYRNTSLKEQLEISKSLKLALSLEPDFSILASADYGLAMHYIHRGELLDQSESAAYADQLLDELASKYYSYATTTRPAGLAGAAKGNPKLRDFITKYFLDCTNRSSVFASNVQYLGEFAQAILDLDNTELTRDLKDLINEYVKSINRYNPNLKNLDDPFLLIEVMATKLDMERKAYEIADTIFFSEGYALEKFGKQAIDDFSKLLDQLAEEHQHTWGSIKEKFEQGLKFDPRFPQFGLTATEGLSLLIQQ